jgi:5-methylthioribose kinase
MTTMFELTADNATDWLRRRGQLGADEAAQVRELADGVSNAVLRVETPRRTFVLKQSRTQLRTQAAWFSDLNRIWRERDIMQLLRPLLPGLVVPEVLFSVEEDYAFAMSHAPEPFRNWRTMLLAGEVDASLGEQAGRLVGTIHNATAQRPEALAAFADRTVFEQLRVEPFYLKIQTRHPDLAAFVQPLIERMRTLRLGLCHGDFSPKNLLVHSNGLTLVDYETGHWGDIAMDLGFFLSHVLLKAVHRPQQRSDYFALTRAFWTGYTAVQPTDLAAAGIGHLAACMLARVDGTSPAPYLTDEHKREAVRRIARRLFREQPQQWEDTLQIATESS